MTEVVAVFTRKDHFCITFSECLPNVTLWKSRVLQHPKGQDLSGASPKWVAVTKLSIRNKQVNTKPLIDMIAWPSVYLEYASVFRMASHVLCSPLNRSVRLFDLMVRVGCSGSALLALNCWSLTHISKLSMELFLLGEGGMAVNQTLDNVCVPVNALLDSVSSQPISKHQGSSGLYTYVLFFILHPINIPLPSALLYSSLDPWEWRLSASWGFKEVCIT